MSAWTWLQGSLYRKYLVYFALAVTAALVASGVTGFYYSYQETRAAAVELQQEKALGATAQIERYIQAIEQQIRWTILPHQSDDHRKERYLDLLKLLRQVPAITEVGWLDGNGRERLKVSRRNMDQVGTGIDRSSEAGFTEASARKIYFGPVYFRKETEPYMAIAISEEPPYTGVVVAEANLTFVWDVVSRIRVGATGHAYVVDATGRLISHPDISLVLQKTDLSSLPQVRQALAGTTTGPDVTSDGRDLSGRPVLAAHARIEPLDWIVFVEQAQREAFAPLYASMLRNGLITLLGVVLAAAASALLARRMVRPIQALQEGAARIGAGALDQRIEIRSGDELETLAEEFGRMAARLRESYAGLEQKVAERTEELVAANRAKSRFLAAASHDLRQPLHAMALFVSALKDKSQEPETRRILDHLTASVEALEGLFDALLDISKLDAGIVRPEFRDFPVQAVFDRIGRECAAEAADKGLRMRLMPAGAVLRSDPALLERILRNLVSNAIRYTNAGGVVVGCRRRGDAVQIAVYDTGVGIERAHLADIFREFYQVGNLERDRTQGLGLGLAIVDRLARLLNHPVAVVSVPGRGSVFSVTVPRGEAASVELELSQPAEMIEGNLGGALIVVIDDEAAVLDGMREVLQQWGCRPLLAGSADEALAQLALTASRPAAVIADYRLRAGETGIAAIGRIRSTYGADIPGVIITGDTAPERLREAEASGYHLLHKPVRPVKLRALLSFLLST